MSATLDKFQLVESIDKAMNECEVQVTDCMKRLVRSNSDVLDAYAVFYGKCENRVEISEVLCSLEKLRRAMRSNHAFVKGPFPIIEIPSEIEYSTMLSIDGKSVAAGKDGKKKRDSKKDSKKGRLCVKKSQVVKSDKEDVKIKQDDKSEAKKEHVENNKSEVVKSENEDVTNKHNKHEEGKSEIAISKEEGNQNDNAEDVTVIDEDSYALLIAKNIDRVLKIIETNGTHYYISLKNKEEHPSIGCKNQLCETRINDALKKLNSIRDAAFEFWIENLNRFAELIRATQLPSIDYYLMDETERENFLKNEGLVSSRNDSTTLKINDELSRFQNALSDMLDQLRSKSPTTISPCLEL
uniref:Uncharacterized protein n=1 Tax=Trichogramma kaykai TaxID=54128 RepID=A0ABD2VST2_9HYME